MKEQKGDRKRRNEAMDRFITDSAIKILGTHSLEELWLAFLGVSLTCDRYEVKENCVYSLNV